MRALKGLALPRKSHSGEIALAGSHRLRSTLAAAPVLFVHAVITAAKHRTSATPTEITERVKYSCFDSGLCKQMPGSAATVEHTSMTCARAVLCLLFACIDATITIPELYC